MTKRYFYTDPLAAAWMAKHFGFRFTARRVGHGQTGEYECMPDDWHFEVHDSQTGKYYIHPGSLHLLEPKAGDWGRGPYAGEVIGISESLITIHVPERHNGKSHFCQPRSEFKVTSRNGVAFMWPESEEA
jgi:hypothetical protein